VEGKHIQKKSTRKENCEEFCTRETFPPPPLPTGQSKLI
jgi:hypothetical protein